MQFRISLYLIIFLSFSFHTIIAQSLSPELIWSEQSDELRGRGCHILSDGQGNTYSVGQLSMGNGSHSDLFTVKYDSLGNQIWQSSYGLTLRLELFWSADIDAEGNLIIMGVSTYTTHNLLVIKFSPNGEELWAFKYFEYDPNDIEGFDSSLRDGFVDEEGNTYVIGYKESNNQPPQSLVMKISPAGELLWEILGGPHSYAWFGDILEDRIAFYGTDSSRVTINQIGFDGTILEEGSFVPQDGFSHYITFDEDANLYLGDESFQYKVTKMTPQGDTLWYYELPVPTFNDNQVYARLIGLQTDTMGNVYVTGPHFAENTGIGMVTTKLDENGEVVWSHRYDRTDDKLPDTPKTLFLTEDYLFVGGTSIADSVTLEDYQLLVYDVDDGTLLAAVNHDHNGNWMENIEAIAVNGNDVYVTGYTSENGHYSTPMYLLTQRYHIDGLVSIYEQEDTIEQVMIFPNPFIEDININQEASTHFFDKYELHTVSGHLIIEGTLNTFLSQINIPSKLPSGAYILTLTSKNEQEIRKTLIKTK